MTLICFLCIQWDLISVHRLVNTNTRLVLVDIGIVTYENIHRHA